MATSGQAREQLFVGPNAGYIAELYDRYLADPASVDAETQAFFQSYRPPVISSNGATATAAPADTAAVVGATNYAEAIRAQGHKLATIAPIGQATPVAELPALDAATWGLSEAQLAELPASIIGGPLGAAADNAAEAANWLKDVYTHTLGYEFAHVNDTERRAWLREAVESGRYIQPLDADAKRRLLERLNDVESFERFLHTAYVGAKRFSLEGNDTLVPMLDEIVLGAAASGTKEVLIGMAHRGRLNVLAHILGKPYDALLEEFGHYSHAIQHAHDDGVTDMSDSGWTGDVKYHMGLRRDIGAPGGVQASIPVILAPNPSHLEYVNPVVEGMTRASQENRDIEGKPSQDTSLAMAVLLHGDAAFPGQGVVAETLNLSQLNGYGTGGTIHIIINNLIGYTTLPYDSRSTLYSSDLAKGFEIPIIHVNADDPAACVAAARMALDYRNTFGADILIDQVGYRRWGHNEGDDPSITQPLMYAEIGERPTIRALWAQQLEGEGLVTEADSNALVNTKMDSLQELKLVAEKGESGMYDYSPNLPQGEYDPNAVVETGVSEVMLRRFADELHSFPDDFTVNPKLLRQLQRRKAALDQPHGIDWALAESLAYASILSEGTPIRMTGQDAERGTFAHRHLVLHDPENGATFTPLQDLPDASSFAIYNSPLSEMAVLGFEYGFSVYAPDTLVLWEAQFGDFANSAQVIIDQFIASAAAKWRQFSGLVLLLPHGYEGAGPEHSSARLERFLQLAAGRNLRIVNCTSAAQYFHMLRRQALSLYDDPRPLVVMTPKSLLRHPQAGSNLEDLVEGRFHTVLDDARAQDNPQRIDRVILCSGKVFVDVLASESYTNADNVAMVRLEELHPFPTKELEQVLGNYANVREVVWLQEEPRNMGAWSYVQPKLIELLGKVYDKPIEFTYVGRVERASPAEGSTDTHVEEQARIVALAVGQTEAIAAD